MTEQNDPLEAAIQNPQNLGEMSDADAVGTVGSPDCGDMLRMWVKFREEDGKKVIDKATFQSFGCQTAIAVASVATEMLKGKTVDQALSMDATALSAPLGPLPPMKIHCGQLVESALKDALSSGENRSAPSESSAPAASLMDAITAPKQKVKIVKLSETGES